MIYDIAAAQFLYGANRSDTSNSTYTINDAHNQASTIWDAGGDDKITVDNITDTASATIDLRGGVDASGNPYWSHFGNEYMDIAFDTMRGGGVVEIERAIGGAGADSIYGGGIGNPELRGNGGADHIWGDGDKGAGMIFGSDTIYGDAGNDTLYGDNGQNTLGTDTVGGNDSIFGGADNDDLYGEGANDTLIGEAGADHLYGGQGNDSMDGGTENDTLYGGVGSDTLIGGAGNDLLYANDSTQGGDGGIANSLNGGADNDTLYGSAGNDTLIGGTGADELHGGAGNDTFNFAPGDGLDSLVEDSSGNDTYHLQYTTAQLDTASNEILAEIADADGNLVIRTDTSVTPERAFTGTFNWNNGEHAYVAVHQDFLTSSGSYTAPGGASDDLMIVYGVVTNASNPGGANDALEALANYKVVVLQDVLQGLSYGSDAVKYLLDRGLMSFGAGTVTLNLGIHTGTGGNDTLAMNAASNVAYGGAGADIFTPAASPGAAYAAVIGDFSYGLGDRLDITAFDGAVSNLASLGITASGGNSILHLPQTGDDILLTLDGVSSAGIVADYFLSNTLDYGAGAVFVGTSGSDTIAGSLGNDTIYCNEGNDLAAGSTGNDLIYGWTLNDSLWGSYGFDTITGDDGNDQLHGDGGDDALYGGNDADSIMGGDGNDILGGDAGNDTLLGGNGDDVLAGGTGSDSLTGGMGADTFLVEPTGDQYTIGDFSAAAGDRIDLLAFGGQFTGIGDVTIQDSGGNAVITLPKEGGGTLTVTLQGIAAASVQASWFANAWYSLTNGTAGADTLTGSAALDRLEGMDGNDTLSGGAGNDVIHGGNGTDSMHGDDGQDSIAAGLGLDSLYGDAGNDTLTGGADANFLHGGHDHDLISAGDGADTIYGDNISGPVGLGFDTIWTGAGNDLAYGANGNDTILGEDGADTLYGDYSTAIANEGADSLDGGAGIDYLSGGGGNDIATGGIGADSVYGDAGNDTLMGGDDNDLVHGGHDSDFLQGENGADTLYGDNISGAVGIGNDTLWGGAGNDLAYGANGNDTLLGNDGADTLYGDYSTAIANEGADSLDGGADNDQLYGGGGNDLLTGGVGADTLEGGSGSDTLTGGTGNDLFFYRAGFGADEINDFEGAGISGGDQIEIYQLGYSSFNAAFQSAISYDLAHSTATIALGGGNSIVVHGVSSNFVSGDFIFA